MESRNNCGGLLGVVIVLGAAIALIVAVIAQITIWTR